MKPQISASAVLLIILGAACVGLIVWRFSMQRASHEANADQSTADVRRMTPQALEREIRNVLPIGSSLDTVDSFLKKRGIEHSYQESSRTVFATARNLKGSTVITSQSLVLKFFFDEALNLTSIEAKVTYTGP
jgi:hypothetical protein